MDHARIRCTPRTFLISETLPSLTHLTDKVRTTSRENFYEVSATEPSRPRCFPLGMWRIAQTSGTPDARQPKESSWQELLYTSDIGFLS